MAALSARDLTSYRTVERSPIRADYRGWVILGPPPPAASGVHIGADAEHPEGYDMTALGFGTTETIHLLAEVLKDRLCRPHCGQRRSGIHQCSGGAV